MRWKWFFNKDKDPNNIEDDYSPKPWDTRTEKSAPVAHDAPELEAFLAGIEYLNQLINLEMFLDKNSIRNFAYYE